ncbi:MAG: energy transducer TonB [Acidobacteriota bacterium]
MSPERGPELLAETVEETPRPVVSPFRDHGQGHRDTERSAGHLALALTSLLFVALLAVVFPEGPPATEPPLEEGPSSITYTLPPPPPPAPIPTRAKRELPPVVVPAPSPPTPTPELVVDEVEPELAPVETRLPSRRGPRRPPGPPAPPAEPKPWAEGASGLVNPMPLHAPKPDYPMHLKRMGRQGTVVVRLLIGVDGRVHEAKVLTGLDERTNALVLAAVRERRYEPGRVGGRPVPVLSTVDFEFVLRGR